MDIRRAVKGLILPASGGGQAYAERTSDTSALGAAIADIPSLTISPVPDSAQMIVVMKLPMLTNNATAGYFLSWITSSDGATAYSREITSVIASGFAAHTHIALITGLTPGTAITVKGRIQGNTNTVVVNGGAASPRPNIQAWRA